MIILVAEQVASMKPTTRIDVTQNLCYLLAEIWWSFIILWVCLHVELCYQRNVLKKYSQFILQIVQLHSIWEDVSGNISFSQFVEYKVAPLAYCEIYGNFVQSFYEVFFFIRNVCYVYYSLHYNFCVLWLNRIEGYNWGWAYIICNIVTLHKSLTFLDAEYHIFR
jgi:hypothetical protein